MSADPNVLAKARDDAVRVERYQIKAGRLIRRVSRRDRTVSETDVCEAPAAPLAAGALHAFADQRYLRSHSRLTEGARSGKALAVVDLFSGIGALSLGVIEAARALDLSARLVLAADSDPAPLQVLRDSLNPPRQAPRWRRSR